MGKLSKVWIGLFTAAATFLSAAGAMAADIEAVAPVAKTDTAFLQLERNLTLKDLGQAYPLRLRSVFGQASLPLGIRSDQVVTAATLQLRYTHSPSLRFELSHLNVLVNDQLVKTLPLTADTASGHSLEIPLDARLFLPDSQLRFELVAHYARDECEDPTSSALWAEISNESRVALKLSPLALPPALEQLPSPFFEAGERRQLTMPFVFERSPTPTTLKAAAIVAAWFGAKADYRGADFPVRYGNLPAGHGVVFTTRAQAFGGLDIGAVSSKPQISLIENPNAPLGRLLVISAASEEGLVQAAQAFALGQLLMQGRSATVEKLDLSPPREPWSSGRWINPENARPLTDGSLNPLSVTGLVPGPISFELAVPPDLFLLAPGSARLQLRYRAAPIAGGNSALNVTLNDQFVGGVVLGGGNKPGNAVGENSELDIKLPEGIVRPINRLDAQFHFRRSTDKVCQDFDANSLQGSIDPSSTLTFRNYTHFREMPALEVLAQGGYPYSRLGDLGGTAFILPAQPAAEEVSAALIVAGHLGRWTQDAATRLEVGSIGDVSAFADRDLLVIGPPNMLPEDWSSRLPLQFTQGRVQLRPIDTFEALQGKLAGRDPKQASEYASQVVLQAGQDLETIVGFESPLKSGRSVVMMTAGSGGDVRGAALSLIDPGKSQFVRGGLTLIDKEKVSGYDLGGHYNTGHLPWWYAAKRWLGLHPYLMLPLTLLVIIVFAWAARAALRRRAQKRLKGAA